MELLRRVRGGRIAIHLHESETAEKLNCGLRLQSGYTIEPKKKKQSKADVPDCLLHERFLHPSLVGRSLNIIPKELAWSLLGGMADTFELDLEASHQQCIIARYPSMQLTECFNLLKSPKAYRIEVMRGIIRLNGREVKVTYGDVKTLLIRLNYGGSLERWKVAHGIEHLPPSVQALESELKAVRECDAAKYPNWVKIAEEKGRRRPKVTCHAWCNEATERIFIDTMKKIVLKHGANWAFPTGDGGIVQGPPSVQEKIVKECLDSGIRVTVKKMPADWTDFQVHVRARCAEKRLPEPDFTAVMLPSDLKKLDDARGFADQHKDCRPDMLVADALLPLVKGKYVETWCTDESKEGNVLCLEYFDDVRKRWHQRGGEERLKFEVNDLMMRYFQAFRLDWTLTATDDGTEEMKLVPSIHRASILCHYDFCCKIVQILRSRLRIDVEPPMPLNSSANPHRVHFDCGTTVDFTPFRDGDGVWRSKPFDEQVRHGCAADRNSKHTGCEFHPVRAEIGEIVDEVAGLYVEACEKWGQFSIDCDTNPGDIMDLLQEAACVEKECVPVSWRGRDRGKT
jgi:hypothetical protein